MQRNFDPAEPEWMDLDQTVNPQLKEALRDLEWMNQWLGANRLLWWYVCPLFKPGTKLRVLDLATGGADIPRYLVNKARKKGCQLHVDAVDFHPATVAMARDLCAGSSEITIHQGDARTWPPRASVAGDASYDLVICTLALHHFTEDDAVAVLKNMVRHTRDMALVLDLERTRLNLLLIELLTRTLIRNRMTVHDARASIRRAFTLGECIKLAGIAGCAVVQAQSHFPCRQVLVLAPPQTHS